MMNSTHAGQAVYTKAMLKIYDLWVVQFSSYFLWRCSKEKMLMQYNRLVSGNHLDIGVGTGYYLKRCNWPENVRLSLLDLNPNSLNAAIRAIHPLKPYQVLCDDIYYPKEPRKSQFDSISMNYLLHCLPGTMEEKSKVIEHTTEMLTPKGILFGATILGERPLHNKASHWLQTFYCNKGIFSNQGDTQESLFKVLNTFLTDVSIELHGAVALFQGIKADG